MMRQGRHWIFLTLFVVAICLPVTQQLFGFVPDPVLTEKRALAPPPNLEGRFRPKRFRKEFEAYFDDHFGFRPLLIYLSDLVNIDLFRWSDQVIFGEDGWLFLRKGVSAAVENPIPIVEDLCGLRQLSDASLQQWASALAENYRALHAKGVDYFFVIAPNKHTIHRQYLPARFRCLETMSSLDRLLEKLGREHPEVPVIDLRSGLRARAARGEQLYYRSDTHWNAAGILAGYNQLHDRIAKAHRLRFAADDSKISLTPFVKPGGDLAQLLGKWEDYAEPALRLALLDNTAKVTARPFSDLFQRRHKQPETWAIPDQTRASALVMHDSFFATDIKPLLANTFSEVTFVWLTYPEIDMRLVERTAPDLVVHQLVERALGNFFP